MIALDAALRRLTVCQLTRESRGNGGGLRPRVWLRLRAAAGGNWTPDGILQLEGEANFSLSWGMKRTQKLLCMGLFSKKLSGPLLTGQPGGVRRYPGEIRPVVVHPTKRADLSRHGYRAAQFEDAFARFLPPEPNIRTLKRGGGEKT